MSATLKNAEPVILPVAQRRPSAVSQVLRAMKDEAESTLVSAKAPGMNNASTGFRIRVAADRQTRERAYRLAHRVYRESGYVASEDRGLSVSAYDAQPETFTLLAEDNVGAEVGTISLAFDGEAGLPCDELYAPELQALRAKGRRLAEVTRLALPPNQAQSRSLLAGLFSCTALYARRVQVSTDFVIEVNPRHVNYYRRLLLCKEFGPERPCPRVNGAPAVLMLLDLAVLAQEVKRVGGTWNQPGGTKERTFYPYFYSWDEEPEIARFLARQHRPMSAEERRYFQLPEARSLKAAQVVR